MAHNKCMDANAFYGLISNGHLIANGAGFDFNFLTTKPTIMNSELILKSDLLDILFDKRNKAYGAYTLRKFYNNRLIKSIAIMMVAVIAFSAFTFLPENTAADVFIVRDPGFGKVLPVPTTPEVKPKIIKPATARPVSTRKFVSAFLFVDKKDSADIFHNLKDIAIGSTTNIILNEPGTQLVNASADGNGGIAGSAKPIEKSVDITTPIDNPDIMPAYPGGMEGLRKFLVRNLNNPRELEAGERVSVKIKFVVGYDGKLKGFEIIEDGGSEFNNEVIRVLKKMPIWIPGKTSGQNVPVYYTIPVKFIPEG